MLFYKDNNMKIMDWYDIGWCEDEAKYNYVGRMRERNRFWFRKAERPPDELRCEMMILKWALRSGRQIIECNKRAHDRAQLRASTNMVM
jgi:hypothetical protein